MKQAILVRMDLKMPKGKMVAQACHASVDSVLNSDKDQVDEWLNSGGKKAVLKVADQQELVVLIKKAKKEGLKISLIKDAGRTFFKRPTITCGAIGPDADEKIDALVGHLKLL